MTDLRLVEYRAGDIKKYPCLHYLSIVRQAFDVIPLSEEARKDVIGVMNFQAGELVVMKGKALQEVVEFLKGVNVHLEESNLHELTPEQMLWYIYNLNCDASLLREPFKPFAHPLSVKIKDSYYELTFQQLISYKQLWTRNRSEGNKWELGYSASTKTLFMDIKYKGGGGILIGIEEDGYAHS